MAGVTPVQIKPLIKPSPSHQPLWNLICFTCQLTHALSFLLTLCQSYSLLHVLSLRRILFHLFVYKIASRSVVSSLAINAFFPRLFLVLSSPLKSSQVLSSLLKSPRLSRASFSRLFTLILTFVCRAPCNSRTHVSHSLIANSFATRPAQSCTDF